MKIFGGFLIGQLHGCGNTNNFDTCSDSKSFLSGECVIDDPRNPVLSDDFMTSKEMTLELCRDFCKTNFYFGVENGYDCYCGNSHPLLNIVKDEECNKPCPGDEGEFCGGFRRLQIYSAEFSPYINFSADADGTCYKNSNGKAALIDNTDEPNDSLTKESCDEACNDLGYKLFGLENGNICACGNQVTSKSSVAARVKCAQKHCTGDSSEDCGGSKFMLVYPVTKESELALTDTPSLYSETYKCVQDFSNARIITDWRYSSNTMTIDACLQSCGSVDPPYEYAGLEDGRDCYCGRKLNSDPIDLPLLECDLPCSGNTEEETDTCGGGSKMQLYTYIGE